MGLKHPPSPKVNKKMIEWEHDDDNTIVEDFESINVEITEQEM